MSRIIVPREAPVLAMPDAVDLIRFEKNLLQIGFFGAHEKRGRSSTSTRRIEQWVNREGKKIRVSAEFRSSDTLGLPSTSDRDKYMAFMKLATEQRLRSGVIANPIRFSGYRLLSILGQCDSGENYESLNSWGMRMADTTITSEQVIYSSVKKRYMNKTVHVFRSFTRLGVSTRTNTHKTDLFEVELEDWLLENLNESFVVPEDFNMYRKLARPTAKGIFVYLYLWFYASQGREVEKDYGELCSLLNVRTYDHLSKIRETMGLSLTDLVDIGYLEKWDVRPMISKKGYKLVLSSGRALREVLINTQHKKMAYASAHHETLFPESREFARNALVENGVSETKATELARKLEPNALIDRIEYVAHQVSIDQKNLIKNPAGYLISFVEQEQKIPSTFLSRREKVAGQRRHAKQQEIEAAATASLIADCESEKVYEKWIFDQVNSFIDRNYEEERLDSRLRVINGQLRNDKTISVLLDRMPPQTRRAELMRILRKEVAVDLCLPSLEEWRSANPQVELLSN